jgi:hypothetical protein
MCSYDNLNIWLSKLPTNVELWIRWNEISDNNLWILLKMVSSGVVVVVAIIILVTLWVTVVFYFKNGMTQLSTIVAGGVVSIILIITVLTLASKNSRSSLHPNLIDLNPVSTDESFTSLGLADDSMDFELDNYSQLHEAQNIVNWNPSTTSFGEITNAAATKITSSSACLTWSPYLNVSSYVVYTQIDNKGTHTRSENMTQSTYTVTGLIPSTKHNIVIFALNADQKKIASTTLTVTTL